MKRILLFLALSMFIFGTTCFAESSDDFVQSYVTDNWTNPGTYRVEGRITKHTQDSKVSYWLHVNARGRHDGFTTKAQIVIGDIVYPLECVDVITSKHRASMSKKSRSHLTEIEEFYNVDPSIINAISATLEPVSIVVNFKNRPDVHLKVQGKFLEELKELPLHDLLESPLSNPSTKEY